MPEFPRDVLARFLPDPRNIAKFEKLNKQVDVDLPEATAAARALADQARELAVIAQASVDMLQAYELSQRSDRAQISALEQRVANLETQLLALQRGTDIDLLRRQIAEIQSLQLTR